jgi:hypothetical protein
VLNAINLMVHQENAHQNRLLVIGCNCHNRILHICMYVMLCMYVCMYVHTSAHTHLGSAYCSTKQPVAFLHTLHFLPLPFLPVDFWLIPPPCSIHKGLGYWQVCCRLFGIEQLNQMEFYFGSYTLRQLRQGFWNRRPAGECLVCKLVFGFCFLKFSFGCTHVCSFCRVLPVLLSNLPHGLFPVL